MLTFQEMEMRTAYMMEQMRRDAIDKTFSEWKKAIKNYYEVGYDNGETTKLYKDLFKLGVDPGYLFDIDFEIMTSVADEIKKIEH